MTNGEKYKTTNERTKLFTEWWSSKGIGYAIVHNYIEDAFAWLYLEAEDEKPLPCPFCGRETSVNNCVGGWCVQCDCGYTSRQVNEGDDDEVLKAEAISAHNRVAKMCREVKE